MATWQIRCSTFQGITSMSQLDKGIPVARRGRKAMGLLFTGGSRATERRSTTIATRVAPGIPLPASHDLADSGGGPLGIVPLFYYSFGNGGDSVPGQPRRSYPRGCDHKGMPILIEPANDDKVRAKCLRCGTYGSVRDTSEEAREALERGA